MNTPSPRPQPAWHKSSYSSGGGNCVEVAFLGPGAVAASAQIKAARAAKAARKAAKVPSAKSTKAELRQSIIKENERLKAVQDRMWA